MGKVWIREVSKNSEIEILGHVFNGLSEIKEAVEVFCRMGWHHWNTDPTSKVEGIHVICVYERYPCFDSWDYANEDREFSNYFFSDKPFTEQQIERLSKLPGQCNAQIVNDSMPEWALPAVYYRGEGDTMVVATL